MTNSLSAKKKRAIPLIPLRNGILFPGVSIPILLGRDKSINALNYALEKDIGIFLTTQKNAEDLEPSVDELHTVGTYAEVTQVLRLPDDTVKIIVEGQRRGQVVKATDNGNFFEVEFELLSEPTLNPVVVESLMRTLQSTVKEFNDLNRVLSDEDVEEINSSASSSQLADFIVSLLNISIDKKQKILEMLDVEKRLEYIIEILKTEIEIQKVEKKIHSRVKKQVEQNQKEYYLNEQINAIQKELGEKDEFISEIDILEKKIRNTPLSKEARERSLKEIKKLKLTPPMSAESTIIRNYIDWIVGLPWDTPTEDRVNLKESKTILDEDHFGLDEVKERILEYISVKILTGKTNGQIICFAGPPGVGKTTLAKSIAKSLNKNFVRASLGGVRDEAEIRGHRRTYIGSMPGKIIQSLKKAESSNPVFLLDEIDKMGMDHKGDPAAALLEVLDPEQNSSFSDHYLELEYDLSKITFILTANNLSNIPRPLLDRMEIIRIGGYTKEEKLNIATRYLIPKQMKLHGLKEEDLKMSDAIVNTLIENYTREAGVRNLERTVATLCRKIAKRIVENTNKKTMTAEDVELMLGPPKNRPHKIERKDQVGLCNGLAYTDSGGDVLQIEVALLPGKGNLKVTGQLGDVMKESASAAMTYVKANSKRLKINSRLFQTNDVHLHVPEGGTPKDGPSAGITMATAIASAFSKRAVRRDIAMTGEITIRGRVLPIGGLKEKLLAAKAAGVKLVVIPQDNLSDLKKIQADLLKGMEVKTVEDITEVLKLALT